MPQPTLKYFVEILGLNLPQRWEIHFPQSVLKYVTAVLVNISLQQQQKLVLLVQTENIKTNQDSQDHCVQKNAVLANIPTPINRLLVVKHVQQVCTVLAELQVLQVVLEQRVLKLMVLWEVHFHVVQLQSQKVASKQSTAVLHHVLLIQMLLKMIDVAIKPHVLK